MGFVGNMKRIGWLEEGKWDEQGVQELQRGIVRYRECDERIEMSFGCGMEDGATAQHGNRRLEEKGGARRRRGEERRSVGARRRRRRRRRPRSGSAIEMS